MGPMYLVQKVMSMNEIFDTIFEGFKTMILPLGIVVVSAGEAVKAVGARVLLTLRVRGGVTRSVTSTKMRRLFLGAPLPAIEGH